MIQGLKVVTALEMARIEQLAYADGASESQFMDNAGKAIAEIVEDCIEDKVVTLLVGKGNNGGDAYIAGVYLIEKGFSVTACAIYPTDEWSPLCSKMHQRFKESGGRSHYLNGECPLELPLQGVILDGLVGTGFKGSAEGVLAEVIWRINESNLPIFAIDIPSGLDGNTGNVKTVAIKADATIYLGLPKLGFFIGQGWDHVGELINADFGLKKEYIAQAKEDACLVDLDKIHNLLPEIHRSRHKYDAGYVLGIAGSPGMAGAAILSSYAALRSGAGIVRLFHPAGMENELCRAPYELIREGFELDLAKRVMVEQERARAAFFGPGMGRGKEVGKMLKDLLAKMQIPCVLDADALYHLAENPTFKIPKQCVLTPHYQEMIRLLNSFKKLKGKTFDWSDCQQFVDAKKVTLVLKGAPTVIFHPDTKPYIVTAGDPGMATAGSGDVLTGIIAACLAQGNDLLSGAVLAVCLHGLSGEIAAEELTAYCMTASDLIEYLPEAFFSC